MKLSKLIIHVIDTYLCSSRQKKGEIVKFSLESIVLWKNFYRIYIISRFLNIFIRIDEGNVSKQRATTHGLFHGGVERDIGVRFNLYPARGSRFGEV